ncbi:hypothetical protein SCA6_016043 [Theobroma cacao]
MPRWGNGGILSLTSLDFPSENSVSYWFSIDLTTRSSTLPPNKTSPSFHFHTLRLPHFTVSLSFYLIGKSFAITIKIEGANPSSFFFWFLDISQKFKISEEEEEEEEEEFFHPLPDAVFLFFIVDSILAFVLLHLCQNKHIFHLGEEDFIRTLPNDPPLLPAKMKGLLRGFRYISHMFDEKEPEMQIGLPTDVKHVAHIGMDGPSANKPSWMTEFNSAPELSAVPINSNRQVRPSEAGNHDSSLPPLGNERQKKSRRKPSIGNGSPIGSPKVSEKHSRRQRSSNLSMDSPGRDSPCHGRRHQNSSRGIESSSQEQTDIPKKSRRKKSKGSLGGSSGSSRSKDQNSLPDIVELGP